VRAIAFKTLTLEPCTYWKLKSTYLSRALNCLMKSTRGIDTDRQCSCLEYWELDLFSEEVKLPFRAL
jgi:hypothetical protein